MAFSGQYAAAQLEKLDALMPRHFPLSYEVASYLGNVTPLMPPTVLRWSRVLGRIAAMEVSDIVLVDLDEVVGVDCTVRLLYPTIVNGRWVSEVARGVPADLYRRFTHAFCAQIPSPPTFEDMFFYATWAADNGVDWPRVRGGGYHPSLLRLVPQHQEYLREYEEEVTGYIAGNVRRNRTILGIVQSDSDEETDEDEEL